MKTNSIVLAILLLYALRAQTALGAEPSAPDPAQAARCSALTTVDFSLIPDAPTQVSEAKVVVETKELLDDLGGPPLSSLEVLAARHIGTLQPYCRLRGFVLPKVG